LLRESPDAARRVVSESAESFHFLLQSVQRGGAVIPDLGVFVSADLVILDYRMGGSWGSPQLAALFDLLHELQRLAPEAKIKLEDHILPEYHRRFDRLLSEYER
jgi:hypothetical protein